MVVVVVVLVGGGGGGVGGDGDGDGVGVGVVGWVCGWITTLARSHTTHHPPQLHTGKGCESGLDGVQCRLEW